MSSDRTSRPGQTTGSRGAACSSSVTGSRSSPPVRPSVQSGTPSNSGAPAVLASSQGSSSISRAFGPCRRRLPGAARRAAPDSCRRPSLTCPSGLLGTSARKRRASQRNLRQPSAAMKAARSTDPRNAQAFCAVPSAGYSVPFTQEIAGSNPAGGTRGLPFGGGALAVGVPRRPHVLGSDGSVLEAIVGSTVWVIPLVDACGE